jgi:hypothetical protein
LTLQTRLFAVISLLSLASLSLWARSDAYTDDPASQGGIIIDRYLQATRADSYRPDSVEVDIDATVPRLKQHGRLRVLRKISDVGKITYHVLGFQGDNTVKNQVIARYLQAEQQGQNDQQLTVSPANYKFKLKGEKTTADGKRAYVFHVSPRAKRVGLFKGEVWLDATSYLPVVEKGRLVKNPSLFFSKVEFERDFAILHGSAVPERMNSTISTRLVGRVNLSVAYSNHYSADSIPNATAVPASF